MTEEARSDIATALSRQSCGVVLPETRQRLGYQSSGRVAVDWNLTLPGRIETSGQRNSA